MNPTPESWSKAIWMSSPRTQHGYHNVVRVYGHRAHGKSGRAAEIAGEQFRARARPGQRGAGSHIYAASNRRGRVIGAQSASRGRSHSVMQQREAITLSIAALPEGKDPDELIRHDPAELGTSDNQSAAADELPHTGDCGTIRHRHGTGQEPSPWRRYTRSSRQRRIHSTSSAICRTSRTRSTSRLTRLKPVCRERCRQAPVSSAATTTRNPHSLRERQVSSKSRASALDSNRENTREDYHARLAAELPATARKSGRNSRPSTSQQQREPRDIRAMAIVRGHRRAARRAGRHAAGAHAIAAGGGHRAYRRAASGKSARTRLRQCLRSLKRRHLLELQQTLARHHRQRDTATARTHGANHQPERGHTGDRNTMTLDCQAG